MSKSFAEKESARWFAERCGVQFDQAFAARLLPGSESYHSGGSFTKRCVMRMVPP